MNKKTIDIIEKAATEAEKAGLFRKLWIAIKKALRGKR